jgi:rapamycin-insensitive companion of mTOR
MVIQLYDTIVEINHIAVMYLEEVCNDQTKLEKVVAMRPALEHLSDVGYPLFTR